MSSSARQTHLILFDCDGTLTDSHGAIVVAMQNAFADCGLEKPSDEQVCSVIGLSLLVAVERLSPNRHLNERIASLYRKNYLAAEDDLSLYPGVAETLNELERRGYVMGIVTGKSKQGLLRVLTRFGLNTRFAVMRTADCCRSKPHPEMVLECMQSTGIAPEQTSLVGDALFDMQMAAAAGVRAYGVSFGVESAGELFSAGAYDVVDTFPALLGHFPPLNSRRVAATIGS